jgi:hypothetical protein
MTVREQDNKKKRPFRMTKREQRNKERSLSGIHKKYNTFSPAVPK